MLKLHVCGPIIKIGGMVKNSDFLKNTSSKSHVGEPETLF